MTSFEKINKRIEGLLEDVYPLKRFLIELCASKVRMPDEEREGCLCIIKDIKSLEKEIRRFKTIAEREINNEKKRELEYKLKQ